MRRKNVVPNALAALALIGAAGTASGQHLTAEDISVLAGVCANCHGPDGHSRGAIPGIAGKPYVAQLALLQAFKADSIPDTTVMNRLAKGYSDAELDALARHFSEIGK
ncbi:c-type cytochrome [Rhodovulum strictum]|uniref:Cytochrome c domain-containing protein n=1 Tax=Rhodovulum strictum TaxID=58314 RepID=A0A844BIM5_9RHOB|nr:hypothetical protein [Rhodovulum strictum]MRH21375.1 hypothetical protein [Rhodovulum strictum]